MEKIAIIDMGSNSIRFVVLQIADNLAYSLVYQEKESIRLGEGLSTNGKLSAKGMERAMTCLRVYQHMMTVEHIEKCLAVATAAVRNAANGAAFLQQITTETGIDMKVITGEREAYLGYLGVINTIAEKDFILFDLGGASIELTLVRNRKPEKSVSIPIGAVTLTEKFSTQGNPDDKKIDECLQYISKKLKSVSYIANTGLPLIGIGGTARAFAKMDQRATDYDFAKIHNYILSYENFQRLYTEIVRRTAGNRKKIAGLSADRADLIVAGAAVIKTLFKMTGSPKMIISGCGLREGLFFEYYTASLGMDIPYFDNILEQSITNYLKTLPNVNVPHIKQVSRIAGMLFDQLQQLHGYGAKERKLLLTAAKMHDVGKIINYYDHARHSAFMIGHAPLYGLTHREQIIASFIAGFHHGISRKILRSYRYAHIPSEADWIMIRRLSTLLALAEASDLTYEQLVEKIEAAYAENVIVLIITVTPGVTYNTADYEMKQLLNQFKKEMGVTLLLVWK